MSEEVSGALPSLISLTVSMDIKPHVSFHRYRKSAVFDRTLDRLFQSVGEIHALQTN